MALVSKPPSIRRILFFLFPALVVALTACSSTSFNGPIAAPVVTVTANPASINAGGSSTLKVTATNAKVVTLSGSDGSSVTMNATGGTQVVSPAKTTTYTVTADGTGGSGSATATVSVNQTAGPTVNITASPTTINAGQTSTLTVTATNATTVTISGSDGTTYNLAATGGTQVVTPTTSTTYTATATGASGNATATATVTVNSTGGAPTVAITANPATIAAGGSSTLTVTAANATTVTISGSDGSSYNLAATGGTQAVTPTATTTYTATATNANGNATATATVTVSTTGGGLPTVVITANPTTITAGGTSTLTVTASNAASVTVNGSDGTSYTLAASGGSQAVTPAQTTTYTATATNANGNATATAIVTVNPTITITANPTTITNGSSSTLTVTAAAATQVTVTGTDGSSYTLSATGGTQSVKPTADTTYTATATGSAGTTSATATAKVTVVPVSDLQSIQHVIFMLQENHTFDNYFGMLNPYRHGNGFNTADDGVDYEVDGIDDKLSTITNNDDERNTYSLFKLKSTCVDDMTSDWLASYGDVNRYDFKTTRSINMDGFVHNAEGFAKSCTVNGAICSGTFSDLAGQRAMGYYDQDKLNYYYYMASQFSMSDRWFSPVAARSVDNRIATFSGGTTQGIVKDPGRDGLPQLNIPTIFQELDQNNVSWKIYFSVTEGFCTSEDTCQAGKYPATFFSSFAYSAKYLYKNPGGAACVAPTQPSSVVGDSSNSFCVDPNHIAPLQQYFTDLTNNTLPSFAFIEAGYGNNDEHPGSGQSVLAGQYQVANIVNSLMQSPSWSSSAFFLSYDEGGGPYDHVPPVPTHSNDYTSPAVSGSYPDISSISVNPDSYYPCVPAGGTPTTHCDLGVHDPGADPADAPAMYGFAAQLGFRVPNFMVSPFARRHYVSHTPMDHTAVIKFVENRFINSSAHLTNRDALQPNLLDLFDFSTAPWMTPPSPPAPVTKATLGYDPCTPQSMQ